MTKLPLGSIATMVPVLPQFPRRSSSFVDLENKTADEAGMMECSSDPEEVEHPVASIGDHRAREAEAEQIYYRSSQRVLPKRKLDYTNPQIHELTYS